MKVFKDVVLMFGFCLVFCSSLTKPWFKAWIRHKLTLLIALYALITVLLALTKPTELDAEILGVVYNLRFLLFFLYGWLLTFHFPVQVLQNVALKVVLGSAAIVTIFGIIQYLFLPNDFLSKFGFTRANGVFPVFFIDDKPNLERVMSTIRDPNSLGSYLIVVLSLIGASWIVAKKELKKWWMLYGLLALLCVYFTFSRSAWVGCFIAGVVFIALLAKTKFKPSTRTLGIILSTIATVFLLLGGLLFFFRNTFFVQNIVFHADESTVQEDPNELRKRFYRESVAGIVEDPLGSGPGTAGLASIRNQTQGTELNENYYLQIASEVGIVGVLLFISILTYVGAALYIRSAQDVFILALFASFAGLAFTNLLVHIWSNEAVTYTWWGLAGLYFVVTRNDTIKHSKRKQVKAKHERQ
jgi:hypothetical protein